MRTLSDIRIELQDGLARALLESGGGRLSAPEALAAATSVLAGQGLPEATAARFGGDPVCTLVSFDADHIQSWVFASERVQVAKGASLTLDELNQSVPRMTGKARGVCGVAYSAGGGGMLFAAARKTPEDLSALEESVRGWLEERSRELTFTVVSLPLYARDLRSSPATIPLPAAGAAALDRFEVVDGIRGALVRLQVAVRRAKDTRPRHGRVARLAAPPGSAAERCPSCGRRPRSESAFTDDRPETWCPWCRGLRKYCLDQVRREKGDDAPTFADLAEASSRRRKYLGFVTIDGNGMGGIVQGVRDLVQLRAFSEATTEIYQQARAEVPAVLGQGFLAEKWEPEGASLSLLSGGDEITLVLPAAAAPVAAVHLLASLERGFDEACRPGGLLHEAFQGEPALLGRLRQAGAAAGWVAARPQYPVRLLRHHAYDLQRAAKRACVPGGVRSAAAWEVLSDSSSLFDDPAAGDASAAFALGAQERLLAEVAAAARERVPLSALFTVLRQWRWEEEGIRSLDGAEREEVSGLLAANFFRYQRARNRQLDAWWSAVARGFVQGSGAEREAAVTPWFQTGGIRRFERLLDLLALEPYPMAAAAEEEDA